MTQSIYYSGGPNINDIFSATSKAAIINGIKSKLVSAGWTVTSTTVEYNGAAGYKLKSKLSPENTQAEVYLSDINLAEPFTGIQQILIYTRDYPQTLTGMSSILSTFTGNYRIIANPYHYFIFPGYANSQHASVAMGGLLLGSGGKVIWSLAEFTHSPGTGYLNHTFREELVPQSQATFCSFNGDNLYNPYIQLLTLRGDVLVYNDPDVHRGNKFINGTYPVIQPLLCFRTSTQEVRIRGRISDAFVSCTSHVAGTIKYHDGAYFECFTKSYKLGSLWLMIGGRASTVAGRSY